MFHKLRLAFALLAALLPGIAASAPLSIQVIIDNSAVLQQPEQALEQQKRLFHHLSELRKRQATREATISVVSINNPRNLWVGTPLQLRQEGAGVLEQIAPVANGCADLRGAFEQVRTNLRRESAEEVRVYVLASLIDTGAPCGSVEIRLPQVPPKGIDLGFLDDRVTALKFFWTHPLQVKPWLDLFEEQGLKARGSNNALDWGIYDEQQTRMRLQRGL